MKKIVPTLTALLAASLFAGCAQQPAAPGRPGGGLGHQGAQQPQQQRIQTQTKRI